MGQEIDKTSFSRKDFDNYYNHLKIETETLNNLIESKSLSQKEAVAGFEIEAWLVDSSMHPSAINDVYLDRLNNPLASAELAKFNIELNNQPVELNQDAFKTIHKDLGNICEEARFTAESMNHNLIMIGSLPTLKQSELNLSNMSDLNRYRALNQQVLSARGKPIFLDIGGIEHLRLTHHDVMLESAATSFQIHLQIPLNSAVQFYNASIIASAACVAISANAPYLFGKDLWSETRIPLFEQSVEIGGYDAVANGPLRRVSFGTDYARKSIMECFSENLEHYPVLLPIHFDSKPQDFEYLRLHNGTIWRWNRPLIGFDQDGTPHVRIEHRVIPAGPTVIDMLANAAFYYGLTKFLVDDYIDQEPEIPFHQCKDNFYQCARYGLDSTIVWLDADKVKIRNLILSTLIPQARIGLRHLNISHSDADKYLDIIRQRAESGQTGAAWQRQYCFKNQCNLVSMTSAYHRNQWSGQPVHSWKI